ncbi:hypothetical protein PINS_up015700 [Pythium insidiosum]|nr:hypothetical protein PINS_up015700 [Pythium insidiosum]
MATTTTIRGIRYSEGRARNRRSQQLFYCAFFPERAPLESVRGVVFFLHGIGEHSHRFLHVYEHLVALGFGVLAYDMVGHGRSDCDVPELRAHAERFEHFVDDTNDVITAAKYSVYPEMLPPHARVVGGADEPPMFFLGISYGCLVGLHTILSGVHPFQGVALASPALGVEMTLVLRLQQVLAKPMAFAIPHYRIVPGVNFDGLTRDPAFYRDYMNDKLNVKDNMTARMGVLSLTAMAAIEQHSATTDPASAFCRLPLLILQGTADIVTSVSVARAFYQRVANFDKEMKEYPGLCHCIYNEPEKQQVLEDLSSWLLARATQYAQLHPPTSSSSSSSNSSNDDRHHNELNATEVTTTKLWSKL